MKDWRENRLGILPPGNFSFNKVMKAYISYIATLCVCTAVAQHPETSGWLSFQLSVDFNKKWQWHNDAGYRTLGTSMAAYQYLYRTGVRYNLSKVYVVALGAAAFFTRTSHLKTNREFAGEFRVWQEVNAKHLITKSFGFHNRFRSELRRVDQAKSDKPFGVRLRYRAGFSKAINAAWSIQLMNEYMQQLKHSEFDQNRIMFNLLYSVGATSRINCGYMWLKRPTYSQQVIAIGYQKNITYGNID